MKTVYTMTERDLDYAAAFAANIGRLAATRVVLNELGGIAARHGDQEGAEFWVASNNELLEKVLRLLGELEFKAQERLDSWASWHETDIEPQARLPRSDT